MLWHRGDPAGRTWHESLGIRFNPISAGKVAVLLEMLLMTILSNVTKLVPKAPHLNNPRKLGLRLSLTKTHPRSYVQKRPYVMTGKIPKQTLTDKITYVTTSKQDGSFKTFEVFRSYGR